MCFYKSDFFSFSFFFSFLTRFWISIEVEYLQRWHGRCHVKLLPSRRVLCRYTIQPCTMSLQSNPHTQDACVFSCNLPPALLAEWPGLLRSTAVTRGWNGYRNKSQHRKFTLEKKILPPLCLLMGPVLRLTLEEATDFLFFIYIYIFFFFSLDFFLSSVASLTLIYDCACATWFP